MLCTRKQKSSNSVCLRIQLLFYSVQKKPTLQWVFFALNKIIADNKKMNKRLILNVMIVALLTFYLIFSIVYRQLIDKHETEEVPIASVWDSEFLVPQAWRLTRLEMPTITLQIDNNETWSDARGVNDPAVASSIAAAWQKLAAAEINNYQQLPLTGITILAFVTEDSQPLVYRVLEKEYQLHFYRMIDQKKFTFPIALKYRLLAK